MAVSSQLDAPAVLPQYTLSGPAPLWTPLRRQKYPAAAGKQTKVPHDLCQRINPSRGGMTCSGVLSLPSLLSIRHLGDTHSEFIVWLNSDSCCSQTGLYPPTAYTWNTAFRKPVLLPSSGTGNEAMIFVQRQELYIRPTRLRRLSEETQNYHLGWSPTWCTKFLFIYI